MNGMVPLEPHRSLAAMPSIANPTLLAIGVGVFILGLLLRRWANRHSLTDQHSHGPAVRRHVVHAEEERVLCLALAAAVDDGRVKPGDLVLIEAIGGGLTWGSALIRI